MKKYTSLISERIRLVELTRDYVTQEYVEWLNNSEIMRFSEQRHYHHSMSTCISYLESFNDSPNYIWAIELLNNNCHIGNINAYLDMHNNTADVGLLIGYKKYWNKGYGYESFRLVTEFLFNKLGIRKVSAGAMSSNLGMIKIMKNIGMKEDGVRKKQYLVDGQEVDCIHMAIYKNNNV